MERVTQKSKIMSHLQSGQSITPIDALERYGCFRLAAIIHTLKNDYGMDIKTELIKNKYGTKYGKYTLEHAVRGPDNMYPIDISGYSYTPPDYWKVKIQNPFGLNKVAFELYQKHDVYSLKGFIQIK